MKSRFHLPGLGFRSPGHGLRGRTSHRQRVLRFEALEKRELLSAVAPTGTASALAAEIASPGSASPPILVFGSPAGSSTPPGGALTPTQLRSAYGINLLSDKGAGQTIAIVDAYDDPDLVSSSSASYATSDLHNFDAYYGLPDFGTPGGPTFTKLDQNGGTNYPGTDSTGKWEIEEALDVEWAHAIAPLANIVLVEANNNIYFSSLFPAVNTARNLPGVSVVSMSFCGAESSLDTSVRQLLLRNAQRTSGRYVCGLHRR